MLTIGVRHTWSHETNLLSFYSVSNAREVKEGFYLPHLLPESNLHSTLKAAKSLLFLHLEGGVQTYGKRPLRGCACCLEGEDQESGTDMIKTLERPAVIELKMHICGFLVQQWGGQVMTLMFGTV